MQHVTGSEVHARDHESSGRAEESLPKVKVSIRDARNGDYENLRSLWRELMDLHVRLDPRFTLSENADQRFFSYLETARGRDDYRVRVAISEGRVVGFAIACVLPNSPVYRTRWVGYINDLCVTQSMRRHGIGEALVKDAVRWLRANGAESIEVYVAEINDSAQKFWRQVGAREYLARMSLDLSQFDDDA